MAGLSCGRRHCLGGGGRQSLTQRVTWRREYDQAADNKIVRNIEAGCDSDGCGKGGRTQIQDKLLASYAPLIQSTTML